MRILVRESIFCCESSEWPWCFDSYDENHILRSWMQNWWESLYENQNFENWKNNTFRHSSRPKWNQRSTEGSLKKRIAKEKWSHSHTAEASCQIMFLSSVVFLEPAWHRGKPQKVNFIRGLVHWIAGQWSTRAGAQFGTYSLFRGISPSVAELLASVAFEPPDAVHLAQQ